MPYTKFICPDGEQVLITDCLKECRLADGLDAGRCLSRRTLAKMAEQRTWTGLPSTTQCLSGTRCEYLKIKHEYAENPQKLVFALFGTGVHATLEGAILEGTSSEERLTSEYCSGAYDLYDEESKTLYDIKTYGSYKTQKVLGLTKVKTPVLDEYGKPKKYKNGKTVYDVEFVVGKKDRLELAYQLNDYRMKLESTGKQVDNIVVEIITRDAGTFSAKDRGILTNAQLVKINKISDRWVERYFRYKSQALIYAIENNELPPPCRPREKWNGVKCKSFCPVWQHCDVGIKINNE